MKSISYVFLAAVCFTSGVLWQKYAPDLSNDPPKLTYKAPKGYELQLGYIDPTWNDSTGWIFTPKMYHHKNTWYNELHAYGDAIFSEKNDTTWTQEVIFIRKKR